MRRWAFAAAATAALLLLAVALVDSSVPEQAPRSDGAEETPPVAHRTAAPYAAPVAKKKTSAPPDDRSAGPTSTPGAPDPAPVHVPIDPARSEHPSDVAYEPDRRADLEEAVRRLRRTDTDGLNEESLPGGGVQVILQDRFRNVPVATITEDGEVRIEH